MKIFIIKPIYKGLLLIRSKTARFHNNVLFMILGSIFIATLTKTLDKDITTIIPWGFLGCLLLYILFGQTLSSVNTDIAVFLKNKKNDDKWHKIDHTERSRIISRILFFLRMHSNERSLSEDHYSEMCRFYDDENSNLTIQDFKNLLKKMNLQ